MRLKFALLATALYLFCPLRPAQAGPMESDLRSKTVVLHSTWSFAASISTHVVMIDLSDLTGTWPNPTGQTGYVNITNIFITTDKLAASTSTVKLGVVTYCDTSTGTVKYFFDLLSARNVSNSLNNVFFESDNSFRNLKVIASTVTSPNSIESTPYLISNDYLQSSAFKTNTNLPNPTTTNLGIAGGTAPGVGDVVMSVVNSDASNALGVTVDILYHLDSR